MPRAKRLFAVAAVAAALLLGATVAVAAIGITGAKSARAATTWPAHVFAPYVDTGLSNTTLTTAAADYGTQFFTLAFVDGGGCQWSLPNQSGWQSQVSALQAQGGDVSVSFGGLIQRRHWTANQWNYDEVPGGPSGAWNNDGSC